MKKEYIKPTLNVVRIKSTSILAGSGSGAARYSNDDRVDGTAEVSDGIIGGSSGWEDI